MHVYLAARRLELSDEIRDYVEKRIVQPLRTHNRLNIIRVEVQLYEETERGPQSGCHLLIEVKGQKQINIRELASDVFAAIDLCHDRAMLLLTEERDRMLTLSRHPKKYSLDKVMRILGLRRRQPV